MQPHQQRVIDEKKDLDEKLTKLLNFVLTDTYDQLDREEKRRLGTQAHYMRMYSDVLGQRIAAFS